MTIGSVILNEREAKEARTAIAEIDAALSSESILASIVVGLPPEAINGVRKSLVTEKRELLALVDAYEEAKTGSYERLKRRAGNHPGLNLIVARIARGFTQKELARKLGLKEQQIQRYEAERYRTISLANFQRVAAVLGVRWQIEQSSQFDNGWSLAGNPTATDVRRVLKHARQNGWFDGSDDRTAPEEESFNYVQRYVADHVISHGAPSLFRTGMTVTSHSDNWAVLAWKSRVTRVAETIIAAGVVEYRPLDVSWLIDLARLSSRKNGPLLARDLLLSKGIVLVVEPHIAGTSLDGAAFLVEDVPVIGMTLLRDRLDNFWFTLMHEVSHVILHHRTGLMAGFFDDTESTVVDEMEEEANTLASNILVPEALWKRSAARIAKTAAPIERFATELRVHPAIVFGRIRKERQSYQMFTDKIGQGLVRRQFFEAAAAEKAEGT
jgi:HTH-type transcriptional regulator/antitoxin HigA